MKAITLWPEWAWAVACLGKDVENRPRPASFYGLKVGDEFAIHAGAHLGGRPGATTAADALSEVAFMAKRAGVLVDYDPRAGAIGHAVGRDYHMLSTRRYPAQSVVAVATLGACTFNEPSVGGWQVPGQYGFKLVDVRVLDWPVSCSTREYPGNRQGGWTLPGPVETLVRARLP